MSNENFSASAGCPMCGLVCSAAAVAGRAKNSLWRLVTRRQRKRALARFRDLCSRIPAAVRSPLFVKVGANDGVTGDPCADILLGNPQWRGVLIEPVPYCVRRLRENYSDAARFTIEQVAIGSASGRKIFYYVDQAATQAIADLPSWYDQLGSFDRHHISKHLGPGIEPYIVESAVEMMPLSELLRRRGIQDIHLLHIDTEGYDLEVLKTLDFSVHLPWLVYTEHQHLASGHKKEMRELLESHGYRVEDCGKDYLAMQQKASFLAASVGNRG